MKPNFKSLPTEALQELYHENDASVYEKYDFETMRRWLILRGAKVPDQRSQKPKAQKPKTQKPKTQKPKTQKPKTQKPKTQKPKTKKKPANDKVSIHVTVKGIYYSGFNVGNLSIGQEVELKRNPLNQNDKNAIGVWTHSGDRIGWVAKDQNRSLATAMDSGASVSAFVVDKHGKATNPKGPARVYLKVGVDGPGSRILTSRNSMSAVSSGKPTVKSQPSHQSFHSSNRAEEIRTGMKSKSDAEGLSRLEIFIHWVLLIGGMALATHTESGLISLICFYCLIKMAQRDLS